MRSLATINKRSTPARAGSATPYISRTFPLAMRGRSASAVTWLDATSGAGRREGPLNARGRADQRVEPADDLLGVAHVVLVVEQRVEIEREGRDASVGLEQLAQVDALVERALGELLDDAVGLVARQAALDEREQHRLREERSVRQLEGPTRARRGD